MLKITTAYLREIRHESHDQVNASAYSCIGLHLSRERMIRLVIEACMQLLETSRLHACP